MVYSWLVTVVNKTNMKRTLFKLNKSLQYYTARSILTEYHILTTLINNMSKCQDTCCLFLNASLWELYWLCIFTSEKKVSIKIIFFLFCLTVHSIQLKTDEKCTSKKFPIHRNDKTYDNYGKLKKEILKNRIKMLRKIFHVTTQSMFNSYATCKRFYGG